MFVANIVMPFSLRSTMMLIKIVLTKVEQGVLFSHKPLMTLRWIL
jgi:hypothetical protein